MEQKTWKLGTRKIIATRAFEIISSDKFMEEEIEYIRTVFRDQNSYTFLVADRCINEFKEKPQNTIEINYKNL